MKQSRSLSITILAFLLATIATFGQGPLSRSVSLDVNRQRLDNVLEILSNKGDFYFSYNSAILRRDSLVTMSVRNKPVMDVLNQLFDNSYEFKESGNYIIIRKMPIRVTVI